MSYLFSVYAITNDKCDINDPSTMEIAFITEIRGMAKDEAAAKEAQVAKKDVSHMLFVHAWLDTDFCYLIHRIGSHISFGCGGNRLTKWTGQSELTIILI